MAQFGRRGTRISSFRKESRLYWSRRNLIFLTSKLIGQKTGSAALATLIKFGQKSTKKNLSWLLIYLWNWPFLQECTRQVVSVLSRPRVGLYAVLSAWLEVPIRLLIEVRRFHLLASTSKSLKSSFQPPKHYLKWFQRSMFRFNEKITFGNWWKNVL